jgi:hypothetical protein
MEGEDKDVRTRDPFKKFVKEAFVQHNNDMMDSFVEILQRLPTGDPSSSTRGATPFKVHINIDIPIFEGRIDVDVVYKWLNMLQGYFSFHNFSNTENITFALLKFIPHLKDWWDTLCEKNKIEKPSLFKFTLT